MQVQMNEAELSDLSHAREPSSKRNSEKYRVSYSITLHFMTRHNCYIIYYPYRVDTLHVE